MKRVSIDQGELQTFINKMHEVTRMIGEGRDSGALQYAGTHSGGPDPQKWEHGVKVTLGVTEYDHAGRHAGVAMARLVGASMESIISIEEGARAMADIAAQIRDAMDGQDSINYDDLIEILQDREVGIYAPPTDSEEGE
ncbi:hypothetical protein FB566_3273 [Stackebrandtia endophytica]|uniref:Uncharacterized protein n=1 Tax=Stackebrandtia endophytica TaxID=1496996 RepID=A0A543AYW1_9ACTN|nr:hypothetical protein [Stackebrandtia endophytica]TQL77710.1 hypothetical protein FB566_3273 [Stackebrandtia endophytica]